MAMLLMQRYELMETDHEKRHSISADFFFAQRCDIRPEFVVS
jgi:hypothetical protein